jgi:hypothetical protein
MFKEMKAAITIMAVATMAFTIIQIMKEAAHVIWVVIIRTAPYPCGAKTLLKGIIPYPH